MRKQEAAKKFDVTEPRPGCLLLRCSGGLSWEDRAGLASCIEPALAGRTTIRGLVLELSAVTFVNSAGLGALFQLVRRMRELGGRLVCAGAAPTIVRMFHLSGLTRIVMLCDNAPAAVELLSEGETC